MADIFNEVDEELRRERLKAFWQRYGGIVVGVALLVVIAVGGWRTYEWWEAKKAAEAGAVFEQAVTLASDGKYDEAEASFARIATDQTAYRVFAKLRQAAEMARRDRDGAVKIYDELVGQSGIGQPLQDLARVRGGMLLLDTATLAEMRARLEPATEGGRVFRHSARETLAFSAWKAGDGTAAKQWYDAIVADPETPIGVRTRTEMLMALSTPAAGS